MAENDLLLRSCKFTGFFFCIFLNLYDFGKKLNAWFLWNLKICVQFIINNHFCVGLIFLEFVKNVLLSVEISKSKIIFVKLN